MAMFDDPEIDKLIIFALVGMVAVLGIAVIFLAVKKNTYYVDENGDEIQPVSKKEASTLQAQQVVRPAVNAELEPLKTQEDVSDSKPALATPISVKPTSPKGVSVTVIINGEAQQITVNVLPATIGRDAASCDLPIKEPAVSRKHARFAVENGNLYIEDVSEHNGTFINGTKLPPLGRSKVVEGDKISLGRAEILVDKINY